MDNPPADRAPRARIVGPGATGSHAVVGAAGRQPCRNAAAGRWPCCEQVGAAAGGCRRRAAAGVARHRAAPRIAARGRHPGGAATGGPAGRSRLLRREPTAGAPPALHGGAARPGHVHGGQRRRSRRDRRGYVFAGRRARTTSAGRGRRRWRSAPVGVGTGGGRRQWGRAEEDASGGLSAGGDARAGRGESTRVGDRAPAPRRVIPAHENPPGPGGLRRGRAPQRRRANRRHRRSAAPGLRLSTSPSGHPQLAVPPVPPPPADLASRP